MTDVSPAPAQEDDRPTADRLIEAAEELYGKHGLNGVSLRQIGSAAGSSNNFAVQYHFRNAGGLVREILTSRARAIDAVQRKMLQQAETDNRLTDTRTLAEIFFRPPLEQFNSRGERSYARLLTVLIGSPAGMKCLTDVRHESPSYWRIGELLCAANPKIPAPVMLRRLRLMLVMVCNSVVYQSEVPGDELLSAAIIDDAIEIATAGIVCPPRKSVAKPLARAMRTTSRQP